MYSFVKVNAINPFPTIICAATKHRTVASFRLCEGSKYCVKILKGGHARRFKRNEREKGNQGVLLTSKAKQGEPPRKEKDL
jgi:hypothetical protein